MTNDQVISSYLNALKENMADIAEEAMIHPKEDSFPHGVQVGKYQGLLYARDILEAILRDEYDREAKS